MDLNLTGRTALITGASKGIGLAAARETAELVAQGGFSTGRVQVGDPSAWVRVLVGIVHGLQPARETCMFPQSIGAPTSHGSEPFERRP